MESWIPLMDIFMNSHSPETEASLFLQSSFNSNPTSISHASFLSLLIKPTQTLIPISPSSSPCNQRIIWMQTLPNAIQARILSFLIYEHAKFNKQELLKLAEELLVNENEIDFWVRKGAHQLFDISSDSNVNWVSGFNLDSEEEKFEDSFGEVPMWLKDVASSNDSVLPWLPVSVDELNTRVPNVGFEEEEEDADNDDDDDDDDDDDEMMVEVENVIENKFVHVGVEPIDSEIEETAVSLKTRLLNLESNLKAEELVDDIKTLCGKNNKVHSLRILNLIEPWNADDEIVPVLLSRLLEENGIEKEDDFMYASNIFCTTVLPKLLNLDKPASRVLLTTVIPYCKVHHKAAVRALLFPLILHKEGINSPICDVITKIVKECLHPVHVSSFCQKLLSQTDVDKDEYIFPPSVQHLVSEELKWTESLFNLFQNILNHNVHLTQDSVDRLVFHAQESATEFPKSLKFANFLLCFLTKCGSMLEVHKVALSEAVGNTSSFLTKSLLSKLASI